MAKDYNKIVKEILEGNFWLKGLKADEEYFRIQDDCDGDFSQGLGVTIDRDGDAWIPTSVRPGKECRFRMPLIGGGKSPRVRTALVILAEAIRLDNEESNIGQGR